MTHTPGLPETEGVIQFTAAHTMASLPAPAAAVVPALSAWRSVMKRLGHVGQDPARYGGYGFGNLSARLPRDAAGMERGFVVTGSQTGHVARATAAHHAWVQSWALAENRVVSVGPAMPSSESLTHGAIYHAVPGARAVLHAHCPAIFAAASALGLPVTPAAVGYGTPAMAEAVAARVDAGRADGVVVMGGHEDGVLAFGATLDHAGAVLTAALAAALALPTETRPAARTHAPSTP